MSLFRKKGRNVSSYNNKYAPSKQSARLRAQPLRSDDLSSDLLTRHSGKLFVQRQSNSLNADVLSGAWMLEERPQDASGEKPSTTKVPEGPSHLK